MVHPAARPISAVKWTGNPPRYQYTPLQGPNNIRVVDARLDTHDGEIRCHLIEIDLDSPDRPAFHTLSYTWGNPLAVSPEPVPPSEEDEWRKERRIIITGPHEESCGGLSATKNLFDFLHELRDNRPANIDYIWIDRICINQEDLAERSSQVNLMGRIYYDCASVVSWLGIEGPETAGACRVMNTVQQQMSQEEWDARREFRRIRNQTGQQSDPPPQALRAESLIAQLTTEDWDAFMEFMQRSWFYRAWTTQESILPVDGNFWCGNLRVTMRKFVWPLILLNETLRETRHDEIFLAADALEDRGETLRQRLEGAEIGRARWMLTHQKLDDAPYMVARSGQCVDPRDHVYSTLGVFIHDPIQPDYSKALEEVFRDFIVIAERNKEDILHMVEESSQRITPNLPSWVPDFQAPLWPVPWVVLGARLVYSAGWTDGDVMQMLESSDPRVFAALGSEEDTVKKVGASFDEMMGGDGILTSLGLLDELKGSRPEQRDIIEVFWRTLTIDLIGAGPFRLSSERHGHGFRSMALYQIARKMTRPEVSAADASTTKDLIESLRRKTGTDFLPSWTEILDFVEILRGDETKRKEGIASASKTAKPYVVSLRAMFEGRRFYTTEKGRLGVGPMSLQHGDRVFIFKGVRYPFLLKDAGNGRYRLVGCCYVDGIMQMEALPGAQFRRVEIE